MVLLELIATYIYVFVILNPDFLSFLLLNSTSSEYNRFGGTYDMDDFVGLRVR